MKVATDVVVVKVDPIVEAVRADLLQRSQLGIAKYGVTLARTDLDLRAWLQHAYEETLDSANYLKRAIVELEPAPVAVPTAVIPNVKGEDQERCVGCTQYIPATDAEANNKAMDDTGRLECPTCGRTFVIYA